jgi:SAM-dependent methyltransferase
MKEQILSNLLEFKRRILSRKHPSWVAYEPNLVPPLECMNQEGIQKLEEWFRWAEEWSMLLRIYGGITRESHVLEIGCGFGRIAFPLRYVLNSEGSYDGFDICRTKIEFLNREFHSQYPHFKFQWANVKNTYYNPSGQISSENYNFPYPDNAFDLVYAASVFTHMLPEAAENYFQQTGRVLQPDGRCLFSCFLLENYRPGQPRPLGFARSHFNFDHRYGSWGDDFAIVNPKNPEYVTAYNLRLIEKFADRAGLELPRIEVMGSDSFQEFVTKLGS